MLRIDPRTNTASADITVGAQPEAVAFSGGFLWVVNRQDHTISQIDPRTDAVHATQGGLTGPCNVAADPGGGVWVTNCLAPPYVVARMSRSGKKDESIPLPDVPGGVVFGAGDVWVALLPPGHPRGAVLRINPSSGRIVRAFRVGRGAEYVDFDGEPLGKGETLWVGKANDDTVSKIDARYDQLEATIPVGSSSYQVTVGGGFVWVNNRGDVSTSKSIHCPTEWWGHPEGAGDHGCVGRHALGRRPGGPPRCGESTSTRGGWSPSSTCAIRVSSRQEPVRSGSPHQNISMISAVVIPGTPRRRGLRPLTIARTLVLLIGDRSRRSRVPLAPWAVHQLAASPGSVGLASWPGGRSSDRTPRSLTRRSRTNRSRAAIEAASIASGSRVGSGSVVPWV